MTKLLHNDFINKHLYSTAILIIISLLTLPFVHGLSFIQKIASFFVIILIGSGIALFHDSFREVGNKEFRLRSDYDSYFKKVDFFALSPSFFVHFLLGFTVGGMLGYTFLNDSLSTFCASGLTVFVLMIGSEWVVEDTLIKQNFKDLKQSAADIKRGVNNFLSSKLNVAVTLACFMGVILSKYSYIEHFSDILLAMLVFGVTTAGLLLMMMDIRESKQ